MIEQGECESQHCAENSSHQARNGAAAWPASSHSLATWNQKTMTRIKDKLYEESFSIQQFVRLRSESHIGNTSAPLVTVVFLESVSAAHSWKSDCCLQTRIPKSSGHSRSKVHLTLSFFFFLSSFATNSFNLTARGQRQTIHHPTDPIPHTVRLLSFSRKP